MIHDTLNLTAEEVMGIVGSGDILGVEIRRDKVRKFLESHKWSLESYNAWVKDGSWTPDQPARGRGDMISKLTHRVGLKACGKCGSRQRDLNKKHPRKR
jgi:hypothetical protein